VKNAALRLRDEDALFRESVREVMLQADWSEFIEEEEMETLVDRMLRP